MLANLAKMLLEPRPRLWLPQKRQGREDCSMQAVLARMLRLRILGGHVPTKVEHARRFEKVGAFKELPRCGTYRRLEELEAGRAP